jgi:hypothetical protein
MESGADALKTNPAAGDPEVGDLSLAVAAWGQRTQGVGESVKPPARMSRQPSRAMERRFADLVTWWRRDTEYLSSLTDIINHPAYQAIILMGTPAIPLILRELRERPDHWFTALRAISGNDPVAVKNRGDLDAMTKTWLEWGRARGVRA